MDEDPKTNKQAFINWITNNNWKFNKAGLWHLKTDINKATGITLQQLREIFYNSVSKHKNNDNSREV